MATPKIGAVVAARIKRYREASGLTQGEVAERTQMLGSPLSRSTIAKVEVGGTRADNLPLVDLLVFAAALDVPPVLLFLPLGESETVEVTPGITVHPHLALEWLAGGEEFTRDGRAGSFDALQWRRNALPVFLFQRLRELQDAVHQDGTEGNRQRLTDHLATMEAAGLVVPTIPGVND